MKSSCINFKAVTSYSEEHNQRLIQPDYLIEGYDGLPKNVSIVDDTIANRRTSIDQLYKEKVKQKIQDQMTPIKEAVIVMDKICFVTEDRKISVQAGIHRLNKLNSELKKRYGIEAFQTYIHFDEGKESEDGKPVNVFDRNIHAHIVFDWQNKETGRMAKLGRKEMMAIQTLTADIMGLQRGELHSKAQRLEHKEYRATIKDFKEQIKQLGEELDIKKSKIKLLIKNSADLKPSNNNLSELQMKKTNLIATLNNLKEKLNLLKTKQLELMSN